MVDRQSGSHRTLVRPGAAPYTWAFADNDEIGPRMLARIAKRTGLRPKISDGSCGHEGGALAPRG